MYNWVTPVQIGLVRPDPTVSIQVQRVPQPLPGTPAWKYLIDHIYSPREVISLIETAFLDDGEVRLLYDPRGDDAQTFVDVIHEVRPHIPSPEHGLIAFVGYFVLPDSFIWLLHLR